MTTYFIASLKHTHKDHEHIVWWQKNHCGYTPVLGDYAGEYDEYEAKSLNDGASTIAVPVDAVRAITAPEPYMANGVRFYDQRGPVVDNTLANWQKLIDARLPGSILSKKPETFRGKRRCAALAEE